ncbi:MAG: hypothetical protein ACYCVW_16600 [Rhodocyclaceae bacterium]
MNLTYVSRYMLRFANTLTAEKLSGGWVLAARHADKVSYLHTTEGLLIFGSSEEATAAAKALGWIGPVFLWQKNDSQGEG